MIQVDREIEPQILVANREAWTAEYVNWSRDPAEREPRRYAHLDIRSALEAETHSKCAYCEGRIGHVAYTHIEHKLPKGKHPTLVCDWGNLTIACPKCNTNKGQYDEPNCPLLDPHVDDVEEEVAFGGPMALARGSARASATITHLKLNRGELLLARSEVLKKLDLILDLVKRAANEPAARLALWLDIDDMTAAAGEFASACRQFLAAEMAERGLTRP